MKNLIAVLMMILALGAVSAKESKYTAEEKAAVMSAYSEKKADLDKVNAAYKEWNDNVFNKAADSNKKAYSEYEKAYNAYVEASKKYKESSEEYRNSNKNVTAARKLKANKDSYKFCKNNLTRKEKAYHKASKKFSKALDEARKQRNKTDEVRKVLETFAKEHEDIINEYYAEKLGIN